MSDNHVCPHEATILQDHEYLHGNGKDGIIKDVTVLQIKFVRVEDHLEKLATSYSALAKSEIKKDALENARVAIDQKKAENRSKVVSALKSVGTVVSIVSGVVILVIKILDHIGT